MTPGEADQRIIYSRQVLVRYIAMTAVSHGPGPENLPNIADEIAILKAIAEQFPTKAAKLQLVVKEWTALQKAMKAKLH